MSTISSIKILIKIHCLIMNVPLLFNCYCLKHHDWIISAFSQKRTIPALSCFLLWTWNPFFPQHFKTKADNISFFRYFPKRSLVVFSFYLFFFSTPLLLFHAIHLFCVRYIAIKVCSVVLRFGHLDLTFTARKHNR